MGRYGISISGTENGRWPLKLWGYGIWVRVFDGDKLDSMVYIVRMVGERDCER